MARVGASPPGRKVLLVEGQDDKHIVRHLVGRHRTVPDFDILEKDGIDNLLDAIVPEIMVPDRLAVGVVVDADDDPVSRWRAVADRLGRVGMETPNGPDPAGAVAGGTPRTGVWIMPDNRSPGEVEDFVKTMIPAGDPIWPRAGRYIDGIPATERRFSDGKALRAKLYAWLATREAPGRMGSAIGAGDLDAGGALVSAFADWLRRLFA